MCRGAGGCEKRRETKQKGERSVHCFASRTDKRREVQYRRGPPLGPHLSRHCLLGPTRKVPDDNDSKLPKVYLNAKGAGLPISNDGNEPRAESESKPPKTKHRKKPNSCWPRESRGQHAHSLKHIRSRRPSGSRGFSSSRTPMLEPTERAKPWPVVSALPDIWRRVARPPAASDAAPPAPPPASPSLFKRPCFSGLRPLLKPSRDAKLPA